MSSETLERELLADLETLGDRFADEEFSADLYRALTNTVIRKKGGPDGHLSLSWGRAEEIVNELRARHGQPAMTLAQTGGEGEISPLVSSELGELGWGFAPLNTGRRDTEHETRPASPPRDDHEPPEWEREAHEEAS